MLKHDILLNDSDLEKGSVSVRDRVRLRLRVRFRVMSILEIE